MKFQKRGAAMISFHWLLIIIAGGAIFILFSLFINAGKQSADNAISVKALMHFDTIFSGLTSIEKEDLSIESRDDIKLDFTCRLTDETADSTFRLSGGIPKKIPDVLLFSQDHVSGNEIQIVSRNLGIPYSVSSALYVTDPNVLYVIEAASYDKRSDLASLLPKNATIIRLIDTDNINFLGDIALNDYRDIVVIAKTESGQSSTSYSALETVKVKKGKTIQLYEITSSKENFLDGGSVRSYTAKSNGRTMDVGESVPILYDSEELLAGIVVSESSDWYLCVKQKLLAKITRVSTILANRIALLEAKYTQSHTCGIYYNLVETKLRENAVNPANYASNYNSIEDYNAKLERLSCPLIY